MPELSVSSYDFLVCTLRYLVLEPASGFHSPPKDDFPYVAKLLPSSRCAAYLPSIGSKSNFIRRLQEILYVS